MSLSGGLWVSSNTSVISDAPLSGTPVNGGG